MSATDPQLEFSDLSAVFINATLKQSPGVSNTEGLIDISRSIMEANGVSTEVMRAADHQIAWGVYPDMTEHGADAEEWPEIFDKVMAADILVIGTPIWLGEKSSICTLVIERLYGSSGNLKTPAGSVKQVRVRRTSMPKAADSTMTSPTATPRS
jgi:multimeric flavodoxin WrbA